MRKQLLSIISAFMISAALLTGCGDTAPVSENATPEAATETEVSDDASEETTDTASAEASDDTDDAPDTNTETLVEDETNTESAVEDNSETGEYIKPEGVVNGYENPELVPKPTDYGKSIQSPDDLPSISCAGWDYEKYPLYYGYTQYGYKIIQDGLTGDIFYPGMVSPDGESFGGDKEYIALGKLMDKYAYEYGCQVTLEQAQEFFGEPDMSTFSTEYWTQWD